MTRVKSIYLGLIQPVRYAGPGVVSILVGLVLLPVFGCGTPKKAYPEALMSENPAERAAAIKHAAEIRDRSVIHILIDRLEDEDEAVRLFAILALEKLTGQRHGYNYHASRVERFRAVRRWRRYLAETSNASGESDGGSDL